MSSDEQEYSIVNRKTLVCEGTMAKAQLDSLTANVLLSDGELKPCPFCGGEAKLDVDYDSGALVLCKSCACQGEFFKDRNCDYNDHAGDCAISAWNFRTPPTGKALEVLNKMEVHLRTAKKTTGFARFPIGVEKILWKVLTIEMDREARIMFADGIQTIRAALKNK